MINLTDAVEEWSAIALFDGGVDATFDVTQILRVEVKVFQRRLVVEIAFAAVSGQCTQLLRRHRLVNIYFHEKRSLID